MKAVPEDFRREARRPFRSPAQARTREALIAVERGDAGWNDVVKDLAAVFKSEAASLVVWDSRSHQVQELADHGVEAGLKKEYVAHFYQHDILLQHAPPKGTWILSEERFTSRELSASPMFSDLFRRYGVVNVHALAIEVNSEVTASLSLHRHGGAQLGSADYAGEEWLRLTNQVQRSFAARYDTVKAVRESIAELLGEPDSSLLVWDASGRAMPLLGGARVKAWGGLSLSGSTLQHGNAASQQRLNRLLRSAAGGRRGSIILPAASQADRHPLRVEAMPLPRKAHNGSDEPKVLVRIMPVRERELPQQDDLIAAFGLTLAQAKVLRTICEGESVASCADQLHCSQATVRTHISHLMSRMGCRRQAELVQKALLLR